MEQVPRALGVHMHAAHIIHVYVQPWGLTPLKQFRIFAAFLRDLPRSLSPIWDSFQLLIQISVW